MRSQLTARILKTWDHLSVAVEYKSFQLFTSLSDRHHKCLSDVDFKEISLFSVAYTYPLLTYYWTGLLILDHSYLVGNLTNSKIAETKAL